MTQYIFAPSPSFDVSEHVFVTYPDAFSPEEIEKIISFCETLEKQEGTVENNNLVVDSTRKSTIAWVSYNQETTWIFNKLAMACRILNGQFYKFDLFGFSEPLQYTTYSGEEKQHYTWHRDCGPGLGNLPPRKLSVVLQLSDPTDYEGGDLELITSSQSDIIQKQKGLIAAFPSYIVHRVTPVTAGIRRTLVAWISGPPFR